MGKVLFEINTKGICLLCNDYSLELQNGESVTNNRVAFKMLLRYLKINILKFCNFSPSFLQTIDAEEGSSAEVGITMCRSCCEVTTKFYQLYEEFERIRLQLDKCVQSLYGSMLNGTSRQDRVWEYQKRIRALSGMDLLGASLGDSLKKEILQKCSLKVEAGVPKVSLPKLNCENVNGGQPKSASSTTILSEPAIPSSSSSSLMTERRDQTAKRSGPKITARARTAATPPSTHKLISNVSENCNIIVPCSGGMDTNQNEPDELDPLVKVEIEMEAPGVEDSIPVDYNTTYNTDLLDTSHYVYPNNSLRNISEMDVSSSSVNHNHIFSVSSNADYAASTSTSIFSSVINQSEKNYKCKTCGSCFDSIRGLNGHMAAHSIRSISTASPSVYRRNKSSFTCKTCGKFFNNTSTLNQHIIQAHSANLPYFKKTNSKIRKHIPCPICGKLVRSDCLPRHSLIHSGETPYSCRYCNRKFRDTTQQLHHEKSQHTMEVFFKDLPHGTTLADIDGIINDILAQMKKISDSSADKRYQCPYCPRKLLEGQKSCSRTHFLHKHFDKVQSLVKSRYGTNFPVDQHSMLMENVTFASDIQHNDEIQNQHFLDPLVTYSH